jgi:hypothetical protein
MADSMYVRATSGKKTLKSEPLKLITEFVTRDTDARVVRVARLLFLFWPTNPCASSPPRPSMFSLILFFSPTLNRDDRHLLAHAMASVTWQFSQREQLFFRYATNSTQVAKISFVLRKAYLVYC